MEKALLERYLAEGLSLERIGKLVQRSPSTVAYWLEKYGLNAVHKERHAPRGGISKEELRRLIEDGLSTRGIARELGLSQATVRHWLKRHRLTTSQGERHRYRRNRKAPYVKRWCRRHGWCEFVLEGRGYHRCVKCRAERVSAQRRRNKTRLVEEAGGRCQICGYDRYIGALEFHHLDPTTKEFSLSVRGVTRGIDAIRAEAAKCVLLCSNCHAEVEGKVTAPPRTLFRRSGVAER